MNIRALIRLLPYLAIVAVAGLVGFSITRVDSGAAEHQVVFTVGAALIAAVAIAISGVFSSNSLRPFPSVPEQMLLGLKVGVVGFCIAMLGWLVAVFSSHAAGFVVVVLGIVIGFVGMAIHIVLMFSPND